MEETTDEMKSEMTDETMYNVSADASYDDMMMAQDEGAQAEIATIREAYAEKINAAIGANDDKLAIELSRQFRDEAFETLFGANAPRRNVA
ncbi:MAG TPA: hypothetical protein VGD55_07905 [Acidothermaceae bacterium]